MIKALMNLIRSSYLALMTLFALLIAGLFLALGANYAGVCLPEARYLSDKEITDAAVLAAIRYSNRSDLMPPLVPYQSVSDFHARHPDCCSLSRENPEIFASRNYLPGKLVLGNLRTWAKINHSYLYADSTGEIRSQVNVHEFAVTNCGRVWNGL